MAAPSGTCAVFFDLPTNRFLAFSGLVSIGESDIVVLLDKVKERLGKEKRVAVYNRPLSAFEKKSYEPYRCIGLMSSE